MSEEQLDRRALLEQAMNDAEEGTLEPVEEAPAEIEAADDIAEEQERNEKGQFVSKDEEEPEIEAAQDETEEAEEVVEEKPALARPSTWKKEYLPIWDKLTTCLLYTSPSP